jgi:hypothetical protein
MKTLREIQNNEEILESIDKDPPMILVIKRKAVRLFPSGEKVALYHSDKLGIDISIPYNISDNNKKKDKEVAGISESVHDEMFGNYLDALKKHYEVGTRFTDHPELSKLKAKVISKYGKEAHGHFHEAAQHMLNGEVGKAARHYSKFERMIDEEYEEVMDRPLLDEASIHKIHHIAKTKTDGEVIFANGTKHKVSAAQAAHIIKMHTLLTPENKATVEKHLNTPAGLAKIADFASTNLR